MDLVKLEKIWHFFEYASKNDEEVCTYLNSLYLNRIKIIALQ